MWVPVIRSGGLDVAENWIYLPDQSNAAVSCRILRVNIHTGVVELWMASGALPVNINDICMVHDGSGFLFSSGDTLKFLNFSTQAQTTLLTGMDREISIIRRLPGGNYVAMDNWKDLRKITFDGTTATVTKWLPGEAWSSVLDVSNDGSILRALQMQGPDTQTCLVLHPVEKIETKRILAGWSHPGTTEDDGTSAYNAMFKAQGGGINDDKSVVYFCSGNQLKKLQSEVVSGLGDGGRFLAMSRIHNKGVVYGLGLNLYVWS